MRTWTLCSVAAFLLSSVNTTPAHAQTELIANGGFETGDFTGWTRIGDNLSGSHWEINDGTFLPFGMAMLEPPVAPISGQFDAISNQIGPTLQLLVCDSFIVPADVTQATFSYSDRIRNWLGMVIPGEQEYRVDILDANLNPLAEIYAMGVGDSPFQLGPNDRVFDLTSALQALEGQEVCIGFTVQADHLFFNVSIDNVSLLVGDPVDDGAVVAIDVKPGSDENSVNLKTNSKSKGKSSSAGGVLPVAILTDDGFDALETDDFTVELGDPLLAGTAFPIRAQAEDVDDDGDLDLLLHFSVLDLVDAGAIDGSSEALLLTGETITGTSIGAMDTVRIVPSK